MTNKNFISAFIGGVAVYGVTVATIVMVSKWLHSLFFGILAGCAYFMCWVNVYLWEDKDND